MTIDVPAVGPRIQRLRTALGLTQRALAEPRYTAAYVSAVESGRRVPSGEALAHFADRLGVTQTDLTTGRSPADRVRLLLRLVRAAGVARTDRAEAEATYRETVDAAATFEDAILGARALLGLADIALRAGQTDVAVAHVGRAEALLSGASPHVRAEAVVARAQVVGRSGDPRYATFLLAEARDTLLRDGYPDPAMLLDLHSELALWHGELDDEPAAADAAERALAFAVLPDPAGVAELHLTVAESLLVDGRAAEAEAAAEQARQAARQAASSVQLAACRRARGRRRWSTGDVAGALMDLTAAHAALVAAGYATAAAECGVELAEIYRTIGRRDEARESLGPAERVEEPEVRARAARLRGLLRADVGDRAGAEGDLRAALDGYRSAGRRRELATTVLLLAEWLQRWDRPDDALDLLHAGLREVELLGDRR
ncbi:transcriptional regulator [Micromonospora qiuiae]|uniref:Transcriptional regulator n=1 Tax=Micromonospora qiuiae TaxID=502268 RepID=A0ABQ4JA39_9ACTN|nr:helix-turn-helix transcriptional regulator [Micromonospora qiuiae]GIJ27009.1 transcriptional regulator [Micromonospora qiuiae]